MGNCVMYKHDTPGTWNVWVSGMESCGRRGKNDQPPCLDEGDRSRFIGGSGELGCWLGKNDAV